MEKMFKRISYPLAAIFVFFTTVVPQTTQSERAVAGLKKEVTVRRDARGIPYIEASSDNDLYFTQGWTTASDRLFQMDLMRRVARGESSEIFGASRLEEDKRWRRFGFAETANQSLGRLSPELRNALESYANGVNEFIATLDEKTLPVEFRILQYRPAQWSPTDSLMIGKILSDALSTTWQGDLLRASLHGLSKDKFFDLTNPVTPYDVVLFGKDTEAAKTAASKAHIPSAETMIAAETDARLRENSLSLLGLFAEDLAESNNFVVSGKRTADGKPILENDPHLSPSAPGVWYMAHLSDPSFRASGVSLPGVPGIILGHNEFIAWGATNVGPDVQDIYSETFNEQGLYKTPSGWQKPTVRKEVIKVRANPLKTETTNTEFEVTVTRNGPIVIESDGKRYALKWTAFDPANAEFEAFFQMNRARNWDEFKAALSTYGGASQNFIYADVKGNIGWYAAGRIPIRRSGDGSEPYDGATNDGDWTGNIPFDELPHLYNPPDGLIVTANQRIVGTSYKYQQMTRTYLSWRARRIKDDLDAINALTMDKARDVQYDTYSIPLANFAKETIKLGAASPDTLEVLKTWDGKLKADSRGALLANEIRGCVVRKIADGNKPVPPYYIQARIIDRALREQVSRWLPAGYATYTDLLTSCDADTRKSMADPKRYGPDPTKWVWGLHFKARFPHPLASVPFVGAQFAIPAVPLDGSDSSESPNVGSSVSMRFIASPGNWDATRQVIPLGISGDPASKHFKDQFSAWRTGEAMVFPFSRQAVEKAAVETLVLRPK